MSEQSTSTTATPTLADIFGASAVCKSTTATIPDDIRATFARALIAFSSVPNTTYVTEVKASDDDAHTYERQIRQYASENSRSCVVKRDGKTVTWRFSKVTPSVRGKKRTRKSGDVTVTNVSDSK